MNFARKYCNQKPYFCSIGTIFRLLLIVGLHGFSIIKEEVFAPFHETLISYRVENLRTDWKMQIKNMERIDMERKTKVNGLSLAFVNVQGRPENYSFMLIISAKHTYFILIYILFLYDRWLQNWKMCL